ncbi:MAG: reactive intermediate/imine deaminase [Chloroflexi bacterium]|nr:reactive intermediate/imine deaminase [Chloroflexota bacterium]
MKKVEAPGAPKAVGPYSHAIVVGDLVYCSGQGPLDPVTGENVRGDIGVETATVLGNLAAVLDAAESGLDQVIKTTVYLVDMADFAAMNQAYGARFGNHRPARTTVGVASLPRGFRVEIECIATRR